MTLAEIKVGQKCQIKKLGSLGPLKRRLMDMGVLVGETLGVEKMAPMGDPIEITVKNYKLSLRKSEANNIEVELINEN